MNNPSSAPSLVWEETHYWPQMTQISQMIHRTRHPFICVICAICGEICVSSGQCKNPAESAVLSRTGPVQSLARGLHHDVPLCRPGSLFVRIRTQVDRAERWLVEVNSWYPEGLLFFQALYVLLYLAMGAVPVAVQTVAATAIVRALRLRGAVALALVGLLTGAATMYWVWPPGGGSPIFGIVTVCAGSGAFLSALPAEKAWSRFIFLPTCAISIMLLHFTTWI